jgi:hypothetical protein
MLDYSIYYCRSISVDRIKQELSSFDIFVSAYNLSDRVLRVFSEALASRKIWLLHPEYSYAPLDEPIGFPVVHPTSRDEVDQVNSLLAELGDLHGVSICIDITGFMRHVLVFLVAKLAHLGVESVSVVYSEPISYSKGEGTVFSTTTTGVVRPVRGMGASNDSQGKDHLIIGAGFDSKLISLVAHCKDDSIVYPLFAFPSLSADMYQQSAVKAAQSGEVALQGEWIDNRIFAPANDPFATAEVVRDLVADIDKRAPAANIYLSPLSTKVQALGFALYWQLEGRQRGGVSMLLPECVTYSRETSSGLKRLWLYNIEFS